MRLLEDVLCLLEHRAEDGMYWHLVNILAACYNRNVPTVQWANTNRAWPSGKAADFGSAIPSSNLGARAFFVMWGRLLIRFTM